MDQSIYDFYDKLNLPAQTKQLLKSGEYDLQRLLKKFNKCERNIECK